MTLYGVQTTYRARERIKNALNISMKAAITSAEVSTEVRDGERRGTASRSPSSDLYHAHEERLHKANERAYRCARDSPRDGPLCTPCPQLRAYENGPTGANR